MRKLSGSEETEIVNDFLDDVIPAYRSVLRSVAEESMPPRTAIETVGAVFLKWFKFLEVDEYSGPSAALGYEASLSLRYELRSGSPLRLDRPRPEMMRTPLHDCRDGVRRYSDPQASVVLDGLSMLTCTVPEPAEPAEVRGARILADYILKERPHDWMKDYEE